MRALYELPPEIEQRLELDMLLRLTFEGYPKNKGNDYERHLFARRLRINGKSRDEVKEALFDLGLDDVSAGQKAQYVDDVLDSVLVGFSNTQPIYQEVG